jgi:hypothetical protein
MSPISELAGERVTRRSIRVLRRPRRSWPPAAVIIAAGGLALSTACSAGVSSGGTMPSSTSSAGSSTAGGSAQSQLLAFAQCMRSHSLPNFPDPQPSGAAKFPTAQELGVSPARYQAAEAACQRLLPAGSSDQFPPAEVPLLLSGMTSFSQCMRSHGVPNWPDPMTDSQGRPVFDLGAAGITRGEARSPQVTATVAECVHLLPSALGGNTPVGG